MKQLINTIIILAVVYTSHNLEAQIEQKKILIVVTNHNQYNTLDRPTGSWLGEVTHFYSDNYIINGKKVSGFSNFEEKLIKLEKEVPFLLEDELVKRGGNYKKGILPFVSKTVTDGRLITGQNPASAKGVAKGLVKWLKKYKLENVLHPEDKEKIISRINNLSLGSEKKWGKMTVEQMICHLLDQVNIALGKIPTEQQGNFIIRSFIGETAALNKKPWKPEKYEATKEMNQEKEGSQPSGDFENDKGKLINSLNEFVNTPEEKLSKHPLFGKMSKKKWGRIIWKNFDHHLRQFSE